MMVTLGTKFPTYEFWGNTPSYGSTVNAIQVGLVEQAHLLPTWSVMPREKPSVLFKVWIYCW